MKNIFFIFALFFSFLNVNAQKEKLDQLFEKYQETDGVTSIKIGKPMFSMLNKLNIDDAEMDQIKPLLGKINGIKILVVDKADIASGTNSKQPAMFQNLQADIAASLKNMKYEELMTVNSKDNKIKFLSAAATNGILDNLLLSINSEDNTVLMMLDGKISMDDVNTLISEMQSAASGSKNENSSNNSAEENRKVGAFNGITVSSGIKLTFTQGNNQKVLVETDADKMQYVKTEVENGILKVYVKNPNNKNLNFKKIHVDVTAPKMFKIEANSGSNFTTLNTVNEESFEVEANSGANISADLNARNHINANSSSGSNMKLDIKAKNFSLTSSSGSNSMITGSADKTNFQLSSAANVNAQDLASKTSTITTSSGANLKVNVSDKIDVTAKSGSSVKYRENSTIKREADLTGGSTLKTF